MCLIPDSEMLQFPLAENQRIIQLYIQFAKIFYTFDQFRVFYKKILNVLSKGKEGKSSTSSLPFQAKQDKDWGREVV